MKTSNKKVVRISKGIRKDKALRAALHSDGVLAVLGPKSTYSDIAATEYAAMMKGTQKKLLNKKYLHNITAVFEAVEKGEADEGLVPLENVIYGSVRETFDQLSVRKVHIKDKMKLRIRHALVTLSTTRKGDIHTIASHEQAIEQCSRYLDKYYHFAQKEYSASTMGALEKMIGAHDGGLAVIIPLEAAQALPLKILANNIGNSEKNYTSFVVIAKGEYKTPPAENKKAMQTSIAFHFRKDSPGRLYMVFGEFANAGINLSHIESRPSLDDIGNFVFFLNFDGTPADPKCKEVLKCVSAKVAGLKILGVYPQK